MFTLLCLLFNLLLLNSEDKYTLLLLIIANREDFAARLGATVWSHELLVDLDSLVLIFHGVRCLKHHMISTEIPNAWQLQ